MRACLAEVDALFGAHDETRRVLALLGLGVRCLWRVGVKLTGVFYLFLYLKYAVQSIAKYIGQTFGRGVILCVYFTGQSLVLDPTGGERQHA